MTGDEARRRFAAARVARLATADAEGVPHVVPVVFAVEGDTVWSRSTTSRSARRR